MVKTTFWFTQNFSSWDSGWWEEGVNFANNTNFDSFNSYEWERSSGERAVGQGQTGLKQRGKSEWGKGEQGKWGKQGEWDEGKGKKGWVRQGRGGKEQKKDNQERFLLSLHHDLNFYDFLPRAIAPFTGNAPFFSLKGFRRIRVAFLVVWLTQATGSRAMPRLAQSSFIVRLESGEPGRLSSSISSFRESIFTGCIANLMFKKLFMESDFNGREWYKRRRSISLFI